MKFNSLSIEGIQVLIARDDLNHPTVSGNKLHKLIPNLELAKTQNCSTILSFGGPYSNHLHALAWACKESDLSSIGVVRGELHANLTPTLSDCKKWGMQLVPSQRKDYRAYQDTLSAFAGPRLASELPFGTFSDQPENTLVIPEGGSNKIAIDSLYDAYKKVFSSELGKKTTHAICATGTGATLTGIFKAAPDSVQVIGIQAVAEGEATLKRIQSWLNSEPSRLTISQGHLGGFGKIPSELLEFIKEFEAQHNIPLDPIYNGKAMFKIVQMIKAGDFKQSDQILFFHTGGLQGKRGIILKD